MRDIQIHARVPRPFHLTDDGLAHNIPRGELQPLVILGHEADAVLVHQPAPFAANRFGNQASAAAGDVQDGGVELHELHVPQFGPGAVGHCVSIGGSHGGIGGLAINLAGSACGQNGLTRPDEYFLSMLLGHNRPAAGTFMRQ